MPKVFSVVLIVLAGWACIAQAQERELSPAQALPGGGELLKTRLRHEKAESFMRWDFMGLRRSLRVGCRAQNILSASQD